MTCPDQTSGTPACSKRHAANRLGLDFAAEANALGPPPVPIIDVHSHITGKNASRLFAEVAAQYGVEKIYSMTPFEDLDVVREALGDRIRFIAVPNFRNVEDRVHEMGAGFVRRIEDFHRAGSRIVKFWAAPRGTDIAREAGVPGLMRLDAPHRLDAMEVAQDLGMMFMAHIADPDTWFQTRYADASVYGTKRQQYEPFEEVLDRFDRPWIAAHMGGWPEDLEFLTGLLDRHANLSLDTSATKWMVRELSRHSRADLLRFLEKHRGRILFGSDIVTADEHLGDDGSDNEMLTKASSREEAYDLYASRYWALRTLFETDYDGESPIADGDLALVDPDQYDEMSAPPLRGHALPHELLKSIYHDAARALLDPLE